MFPGSKRVTLVSPSRTIACNTFNKIHKTSAAMGFGLAIGVVIEIAKFAAAVLTGNPGILTP